MFAAFFLTVLFRKQFNVWMHIQKLLSILSLLIIHKREKSSGSTEYLIYLPQIAFPMEQANFAQLMFLQRSKLFISVRDNCPYTIKKMKFKHQANIQQF